MHVGGGVVGDWIENRNAQGGVFVGDGVVGNWIETHREGSLTM